MNIKPFKSKTRVKQVSKENHRYSQIDSKRESSTYARKTTISSNSKLKSSHKHRKKRGVLNFDDIIQEYMDMCHKRRNSKNASSRKPNLSVNTSLGPLKKAFLKYSSASKALTKPDEDQPRESKTKRNLQEKRRYLCSVIEDLTATKAKLQEELAQENSKQAVVEVKTLRQEIARLRSALGERKTASSKLTGEIIQLKRRIERLKNIF